MPSWLVSAREPGQLLLTVLAFSILATLTVGIVLLHRHIELLIDQTGTLQPWTPWSPS
jgi:hypothetical protein